MLGPGRWRLRVLIDTHAHLDMPEFKDDLPEVLRRAREQDVLQTITVGIDLESSRSAVAIAAMFPEVHATVGCHPHGAGEVRSADLEGISRLSSSPKVVAWGEIGLDFFRRYAPREDQLRVFSRQLETARELGLPVVIHDRDAHEEVLSALRRVGKQHRPGVIHCFSGDHALAMDLVALGYYISIPGTVTYKQAAVTREVATQLPLDRLLVETDAPFLAPVPKRGKRNEPAYVRYTAETIAGLRGIPFEALAEATSRNARHLFSLPEVP